MGREGKLGKCNSANQGRWTPTWISFLASLLVFSSRHALRRGLETLRRTKNYLMPETNTWFWVTRSPQDSALSLPLPGTFPVCLHLLLCWNTNNFRECASRLACSSRQAWLHDISLGWLPAVTNPHCKLTLFSPGHASSSRKNIFLLLFTAILCSWPQKLSSSLSHFAHFHTQSISKFCQAFLKQLFFPFFLHFYCWSLLTWITLLSLNCFLYDLAHSILPDLLMPQHYSLNT